MAIDDSDVRRVLCLAAHPDDLDFGAAGTIAGFTRSGIEVTYLLCTRGDQGGFDDTPREAMPALREKEQRDAAAAVGVADVRFLDGYRDGWLEAEPRPATRHRPRDPPGPPRPDADPLPGTQLGPDRAPATPTTSPPARRRIRAIYPAARNPFAYPELLQDEGLEPWTVREVWLMADAERRPPGARSTPPSADKLDALHAHRSQTSHMADLEALLRDWAIRTAGQFDLPEGSLAEAFRVIATA